MLYDEINQDPRRDESTSGQGNDPRAQRPIADREVPLAKRSTPAAVHAWLDGDLPEAAVRRGDMAHDVEFWQHINREMDNRRHMRTPAHVFDQIMEALPQTAPTVITPWWRRAFVTTPAAAAALGAGVLAIGAAIAAWLMHAR
jgi:hypothetical protein